MTSSPICRYSPRRSVRDSPCQRSPDAGKSWRLFASGRVNHSGTYNANIVSLSAALAVAARIVCRQPSGVQADQRRWQRADGGIHCGSAPVAASTCRSADCLPPSTPASPVILSMTTPRIRRADHERLGLFLDALLERGVRPTARGTWFVSAFDGDTASTLEAVGHALKQCPKKSQPKFGCLCPLIRGELACAGQPKHARASCLPGHCTRAHCSSGSRRLPPASRRRRALGSALDLI